MRAVRKANSISACCSAYSRDNSVVQNITIENLANCDVRHVICLCVCSKYCTAVD